MRPSAATAAAAALAAAATLASLPALAPGYPLPLPLDNVVDVTTHGAKGDGKHDDTAAVLAAVGAARALVADPGSKYPAPHYGVRVLYFPRGEYVVSDTIQLYMDVTEFPNGTVLPPYFYRISLELIVMGESAASTVIRLKDSTPAFADASSPQPLFRTFPGWHHNDGQWLTYQDLTLSTGAGNPGAVALNHVANNVNGLYDLVLRSEDKNGLVGLNFSIDTGGQTYWRGIDVSGFKTGIIAGSWLMGVALEHVRISDAAVGLLVVDKLVQVRDLYTAATVGAPVVLFGAAASAVVVDSVLGSTGEAVAAIDNRNGSQLYVRNVTAPGSRLAVAEPAGAPGVPGPTVKEFSHHGPTSGFAGSPRSSPFAGVRVPATPAVPALGAGQWTVFDLDTVSFHNATEVIQGVIDSGVKNLFLKASYPPKSTPYHPPGVTQLMLRGSLQRLHGGWNDVGSALFKHAPPGFMALRVDTMAHAGTVVVEGFRSVPGVHQNSTHTLVVRMTGCSHPAATCYQNTPGADTGDVFFEEFNGGGGVVGGSTFPVGPTFRVSAPGRVWARGVDIEGTQRHVHIEGGSFWTLGNKLGESQGLPTLYAQGGRVEMLGGVFNGNMDTGYPTVVVNNSALSLIGWTVRFYSANFTKNGTRTGNLVNETFGDREVGLSELAFPFRTTFSGWFHNESTLGNHVPFYRSKADA